MALVRAALAVAGLLLYYTRFRCFEQAYRLLPTAWCPRAFARAVPTRVTRYSPPRLPCLPPPHYLCRLGH